MKVKNIAFSGFMAAIMLSVTGAANAAVKIASQQYVDDAAGDINENLTKNYSTTEQVQNSITQNISNAITADNGAIKTALDAKADANTVTQLNTDVSGLKTTVGDATTGLVKDVNALTTAVNDEQSGLAATNAIADAAAAAAATAQDDVDTLAGVVNSTENGLATKASQTDLNALGTRVSKNETDIKALNDNLDKTVADSIAGALSSEGAIKDAIDAAVGDLPISDLTNDVSALKTTVGNSESGLVKDVADNTAAIGNRYTKTETDNAIQTYALPKPSKDCASGMCVLSVGADGETLTWVDVTTPYESTGNN